MKKIIIPILGGITLLYLSGCRDIFYSSGLKERDIGIPSSTASSLGVYAKNQKAGKNLEFPEERGTCQHKPQKEWNSESPLKHKF